MTISYSGYDDPDNEGDAGALQREAQVGQLARMFRNLGVPAYITSDHKLIAEKPKERERPIILNGTPNIVFIDALASQGFSEIKTHLKRFEEMGFPVVRIDKFAGSDKDNTLIIIGHSTEALLGRLQNFARQGYFKNKTVALIICGALDFTDMEMRLKFLKTIDVLNKEGAQVVSSFETLIKDQEAGNLLGGLKDSVERILKGQMGAITLTEGIIKAIRDKNIENLKNNIRFDIFRKTDFHKRFAGKNNILSLLFLAA